MTNNFFDIKTLYFSVHLKQKLLNVAKAARPYEACGLVRLQSIASTLVVDDIYRVSNCAADKLRSFRISKQDIIKYQGIHNNKAKSKVCFGVFHTHGIGTARPSLHDLWSMRARPGIYLIADAKGLINVFISLHGLARQGRPKKTVCQTLQLTNKCTIAIDHLYFEWKADW